MGRNSGGCTREVFLSRGILASRKRRNTFIRSRIKSMRGAARFALVRFAWFRFPGYSGAEQSGRRRGSASRKRRKYSVGNAARMRGAARFVRKGGRRRRGRGAARMPLQIPSEVNTSAPQFPRLGDRPVHPKRASKHPREVGIDHLVIPPASDSAGKISRKRAVHRSNGVTPSPA